MPTENELFFIASLPDPTASKPTQLKSGDLVIRYYENPKTYGERFGMSTCPFVCPQVAVVSFIAEQDPHLIVRVEDSSSSISKANELRNQLEAIATASEIDFEGTAMLCSLNQFGAHTNLGPWSRTDRDSFIRKALEIAA